VLNQYLKNYVSIDKKDWVEHSGLAKFCYNSTSHSMTKMFNIGKQTKKPRDFATPMGRRDHSKETMEMVKGREEKYA
jgi:hypothetical protein